MEIFIGIRDNTRQLGLDVDMSENELMAKVNEALASPTASSTSPTPRASAPSYPPTPSATCRSPTRPSVASASRSTNSRPDKRGRGTRADRNRPRNPGLVYTLWPQAFR